MSRLFALAATLLFAAGCYAPYLKVNETFDPAKGGKAWVESFLVTIADDANIAERTLFAGQVKEGGTALTEKFNENKALFGGLDPYFDKARAKKLGMNNVFGDEASAFLNASWFHPETFQVPVTPINIFTSFGSVFEKFEPEFQDSIMSIRVEMKPVAPAFVPVGFRSTQATVSVNVFDRTGTKLFMSSSRGAAGFSFLVGDYSPETLSQAFDRALKALKDVKVEKLNALDKLVLDADGPPRAVALARR